MKGKRLTEAQKGQMARGLVYYCIGVLSIAALWALILKTYGAIHNVTVDLSDVLPFVSVAFGGELLMLLAKRIFAKPTTKNEQEETV
ncbi:MAG: hypothetical protein IJ484_03980 [Oscillospiraceae bacterium]|nr:hypothetical protein [Oscillospiraceae bacterium]